MPAIMTGRNQPASGNFLQILGDAFGAAAPYMGRHFGDSGAPEEVSAAPMTDEDLGIQQPQADLSAGLSPEVLRSLIPQPPATQSINPQGDIFNPDQLSLLERAHTTGGMSDERQGLMYPGSDYGQNPIAGILPNYYRY